MATIPITMVAAIRDVQKHDLTGSDRRKRLIGALATANAPTAGLLLGQRQTREVLDARDEAVDVVAVDVGGGRPDVGKPHEADVVEVHQQRTHLQRIDGSNEKAAKLVETHRQQLADVREAFEIGSKEGNLERAAELLAALDDATADLDKRIALTDRYIDSFAGELGD